MAKHKIRTTKNGKKKRTLEDVDALYGRTDAHSHCLHQRTDHRTHAFRIRNGADGGRPHAGWDACTLAHNL